MIDADLALNAGALGGLLALAVLLGPWRARLGWPLMIGLVVVGLGLGFGLNVIALGAPLTPFPGEALFVLLLWLLLGRLANEAGGVFTGQSWGFAALFGAMLSGDQATATRLAPLAPTPKLAARLALVAGVGGLMSPIGSPARLLLRDIGPTGLLPVGLALLAWPYALERAPKGPGGRLAVTAVLSVVLIFGFRPEWRLPVLAFGCVALALLAGARAPDAALGAPGREVAWALTLGVLVGLARTSGALAELRLGLAWLFESSPDLALVAVVLGGAALSALAGELGAALIALSVVEAGAEPLTRPLTLVLTAGLAVGVGAVRAAAVSREARRGLVQRVIVMGIWTLGL
ncbi:hypothetical protein L6R49_15335 [Myxococcota bacterium]|nr:hypothetical protein [Myxococcota bacterium]